MRDEYNAIGEAAGKIYRALEQGEQAVSKLQKASQVSDEALFNQALGWLAREEKVTFKAGKTPKVALCSAGAVR
ncbi:MAG TPA: winged helix-turn-helix domain-containing protein [Verrucomicrobiae bacterium]|jgi:hypothetical protein|nr:winged helix-turn-helix domain-containing protein [Verrucomicrobiae bacterium]